jgi:hypothetical protein
MSLKGHPDEKKLLPTAPKTYLNKKERRLVEEVLGVVAARNEAHEGDERSCHVSQAVRVLSAALQKVVTLCLDLQDFCFWFHVD